jgi:hypothetical protein
MSNFSSSYDLAVWKSEKIVKKCIFQARKKHSYCVCWFGANKNSNSEEIALYFDAKKRNKNFLSRLASRQVWLHKLIEYKTFKRFSKLNVTYECIYFYLLGLKIKINKTLKIYQSYNCLIFSLNFNRLAFFCRFMDVFMDTRLCISSWPNPSSFHCTFGKIHTLPRQFYLRIILYFSIRMKEDHKLREV